MKIGLFIDYYETGAKSRELVNDCLQKFLDCGYDIFFISNNITSIDIPINKLKYFEYDPVNRLHFSKMKPFHILSDSWLGKQEQDESFYRLSLLCGAYNPADWSVFYNIAKAAQLMKDRGYDYMLKLDYDVVRKNYDVLNTIFKNFNGGSGQTIESKFWGAAKFGGLLNNFLLSTDLISLKIPLNKIQTDEGYQLWVKSLKRDFQFQFPIFEGINSVLFRDCSEVIPYENIKEQIIDLDANMNIVRNFRAPYFTKDALGFFDYSLSSFILYNHNKNNTIFMTVDGEPVFIRPEFFKMFPIKDKFSIKTQTCSVVVTREEYDQRLITGKLTKQ